MGNFATLKGCGTALATPFKADGALDEVALHKFVDFQVSGGIDFLVPCGTTGESPTLTNDERCRVVEITVKVAAGRVPVIAGAGGNNTAEVIELIHEYEKIGIDGILSVTPYYNKPTQEGLFQHFKAIAESTSLPIILYNVPPRTSVNMLPDTIGRLAHIPNVMGVKEACGDISQMAELFLRAPEDFIVLSGDDAVTLPLMALGGVGVISVASNETPQLMAALARSCLSGNYDEARKLNRKLIPLMKANFIETSPAPVKAGLAMMGLMEETLRLPLVPIKPENKERLRAVMAELRLV